MQLLGKNRIDYYTRRVKCCAKRYADGYQSEDQESAPRALAVTKILTLTALLHGIYNAGTRNFAVGIFEMDEHVKFSTVIQPWGNSLGLRITRPLGQMARLRKGSRVTIELVDEGLLVKPAVAGNKRLKLPFTEAQLIAGLTPDKAHADELPVLLADELEH